MQIAVIGKEKWAKKKKKTMMGIHLGCLYLYDTDAITHQMYYNYKSQPVIMHP